MLALSSTAVQSLSCCLSITEWQHMSESEDNQSIISHHCAAMILVVDTEDGSLLKPSECKAFLSQSVAWRYIFKYVIQKRLKKRKKKKKAQSQDPHYVFSGIIDHSAQQYNLFHLKSLCAAIYMQRYHFSRINEIEMWLHIKVYTSRDLWRVSLAVHGIREVVSIKALSEILLRKVFAAFNSLQMLISSYFWTKDLLAHGFPKPFKHFLWRFYCDLSE